MADVTYENSVFEPLMYRPPEGDPLENAKGGEKNVAQAEAMVRKSKLEKKFEKAAACAKHKKLAKKLTKKFKK